MNRNKWNLFSIDYMIIIMSVFLCVNGHLFINKLSWKSWHAIEQYSEFKTLKRNFIFYESQIFLFSIFFFNERSVDMIRN